MSETLNAVYEDQSHIPGTVHLIDLDGALNTRHADGQQKDIVLIPAPTDDPDDPLNWVPSRKKLALMCVVVYMMAVGVSSAAIYSVLGNIIENTSLTLDDLNSGTGYMFLLYGWGTLIWQPLALQYGKRPVYLISVLGTMAVMVWAPYTTTKGQWIASKILQGFFGAPIESLCEISITDLYFTHERGFYMAVYAISLSGSNLSAPIIAGFIAQGQGWQWVLLWCAILCAVAFVFLFFAMEETNFVRHAAARAVEPATNIPEKGAAAATAESGASDLESSNSQKKSRKTYWDKIKLWQKADLEKPNELLGMIRRPLSFLTFPVIFFCGFYYGSSLIWFNVLNGTSALILGGQYNFSTSMIGVSYIAPLLGVVVGAAYTGIFGNRFTLRKARKNGGILESEFRLWILTPPILLLPFGLILWGVGAAQHVHWFGVLFAMFIVSGASSLSVQGMCTYCVESYRALSGEAIITVILIRNTMSFAIGYGITPWVTNMGLQNAFIVAAFAGMVQCATVLPIIRWGKSLRERSVQKYSKYVEELSKAGMAH